MSYTNSASQQTQSFVVLDQEQALIQSINRFRLKSASLIMKLKKIIDDSIGSESKTIKFEHMNKVINISEVSLLIRLRTYLDDIDVVNQILPDFSCNQKFQDIFKKRFKQISQISILDDNLETLKKSLKSQAFYGYSLKMIHLHNLDELLMLLIIEEFLQLIDLNYRSENLILESLLPITPEHLGLLSHDFTSICVRVQPIDSLFNVYILLSSSDIFSEVHMQVSNSNRQTILLKTLPTNTLSQPPSKYQSHCPRTTQIPRSSIKVLIKQMDTNNDGLIGVKDIIQFSQKHFLFFDQEIAQQMIKDASIIRTKLSNNDVNEEEILAAVQIHYYLNEEHKWTEKHRPFRQKWVDLLKAAGENLPTKHDLSPLSIEPIKDLHEMPDYPYKPNLLSSHTLMQVKPLQPKVYRAPYRPEAGIIINNTHNIQEVINSVTFVQELRQDPFEKVINQRMYNNDNEQELPTIKFETKQYYQEAERLSRIPSLINKGRNPIYNYLPETTFTIKQTKQNKVYSSLNSPEFHESGFYREIGEIQEEGNLTNIDQHLSQKGSMSVQKVNKINKQQTPGDKPFLINFKLEDCASIKQRLASMEPILDPYLPPSDHEFRHEYVHGGKKPHFSTRFKPDPLLNPHLMSDHDQRPQFAIEQEIRDNHLKKMDQERRIAEYMGTQQQSNEWIKYYRLADRLHNVANRKRPEFIDKGPHNEDHMAFMQMLRGEAEFSVQFKLFHRQLRRDDKNLFLGQTKE